MADGLTSEQRRAAIACARKGWVSPPDARIDVLRRLAAKGYLSQCGRLFHPTRAAERLAGLSSAIPNQKDLFT